MTPKQKVKQKYPHAVLGTDVATREVVRGLDAQYIDPAVYKNKTDRDNENVVSIASGRTAREAWLNTAKILKLI